MTRAQRHILTMCARPEGFFEHAWDSRAVESLEAQGLIEKRGVVWVLIDSGKEAFRK